MVQVSIYAGTNDYLRCTKCEVHDRVCEHVIRYTNKRVTRFLILEALFNQSLLIHDCLKWSVCILY